MERKHTTAHTAGHETAYEVRIEKDPRSSFGVRTRVAPPRLYEEADVVTLQFQIGEVQSQMRMSDPHGLVLAYTRAMVSFLRASPVPRRIAMIGLGGGSMAKWCYRQLPETAITVVEINPMVIALREEFLVPADDARFRVLLGDGAEYVAYTEEAPEVLLVDGFDVEGQPPQLCSQAFYEDCYRALAADGVLVVNLCGPEEQEAMERIRRIFAGRVQMVQPADSENKIVFAVKGRRHQIEQLGGMGLDPSAG
jgi:spermidine synthase